MAKDYKALALSVVERVGGNDNIVSVTHCITRLRFVLKDSESPVVSEVKKIPGVIDVIIGNGQFQVVIGTDVSDAYDAVLEVVGANKAADAAGAAASAQKEGAGVKKNPLDLLTETVTGIFMPVLGVMSAVGLVKAVVILLTNFGLLSKDSGTYLVLYAAADAFFAFLPFALAFSSAERFKCNKFLALAVVGVLMYSSVQTAYSEGTAVDFLGIPVTLMNYTSSVIPAIFTVYLLSWVERLAKRFVPKSLQFFLAPAICVVLVVPIELIVIGPLSMLVGNACSAAFLALYNVVPVLAAAVFAGLWPVLIIFGAHWAFNPIVLNNLSTLGYDWMSPLTFGCNFAMAGACLGVFLRTKNAHLKELAGPNVITALLAGVTEPAIYGVNLKYKKPFVIACLCAAVGGMVVSIAGTQRLALVSVNLLTLPAIAVFPGGWGVLVAAAIGFVGATVLTYLFGFDDSMIPEEER